MLRASWRELREGLLEKAPAGPFVSSRSSMKTWNRLLISQGLCMGKLYLASRASDCKPDFGGCDCWWFLGRCFLLKVASVGGLGGMLLGAEGLNYRAHLKYKGGLVEEYERHMLRFGKCATTEVVLARTSFLWQGVDASGLWQNSLSVLWALSPNAVWGRGRRLLFRSGDWFGLGFSYVPMCVSGPLLCPGSAAGLAGVAWGVQFAFWPSLPHPCSSPMGGFSGLSCGFRFHGLSSSRLGSSCGSVRCSRIGFHSEMKSI